MESKNQQISTDLHPEEKLQVPVVPIPNKRRYLKLIFILALLCALILGALVFWSKKYTNKKSNILLSDLPQKTKIPTTPEANLRIRYNLPAKDPELVNAQMISIEGLPQGLQNYLNTLQSSKFNIGNMEKDDSERSFSLYLIEFTYSYSQKMGDMFISLSSPLRNSSEWAMPVGGYAAEETVGFLKTQSLSDPTLTLEISFLKKEKIIQGKIFVQKEKE